MEVYINGEKVPITLEKGDSTQKVLEEVEKWLKKVGDYYVVSYEITLKNQKKGEITSPIEEVSRIDIEAGDIVYLYWSFLKEFNHYLDKLGPFLMEKKPEETLPEEKKQIEEGLNWIQNGLEEFKKVPIQIPFLSISPYVEKISYRKWLFSPEEVCSALVEVRNITEILEKYFLYEILPPEERKKALEKILQAFQKEEELLESLIEKILEGELSDMFYHLHEIMMLLWESLFLLKKEGEEYDAFREKLEYLLEKLIHATSLQDWVSLQEILDQDLREFLREFTKKQVASRTP